MNNKLIAGMAVIVVVVGAAAFYGGMLYGRSSALAANPLSGRFANFSGGQRGARLAGGSAGSGANTAFASGSIIAKDAQSITVQLSNNGSTTTPNSGTGSKIVFLNSSTPIMKTTAGSLQDLGVGTVVMVTGAANSDGSIQAQDVQIRPIPSAGNSQ